MDVGCGYGGMLEGLSRYGHTIGLEVALEAAKFCKQRQIGDVCLGSGYALPVQSGTLDLITLFDAIEHIEDDQKVVLQCRDALKPGGHLMITVPAYQFLYADNDRISHHFRRYTRSQLIKIVEKEGLEVVKATYFNVLLFPLILPAVLLLKLIQAIRGTHDRGVDGGQTNLSYSLPKPISAGLKAIFSSERKILTRISAPFGHSIALIAKKPKSHTADTI
jgi:SAM-dependent methyltransferase